MPAAQYQRFHLLTSLEYQQDQSLLLLTVCAFMLCDFGGEASMSWHNHSLCTGQYCANRQNDDFGVIQVPKLPKYKLGLVAPQVIQQQNIWWLLLTTGTNRIVDLSALPSQGCSLPNKINRKLPPLPLVAFWKLLSWSVCSESLVAFAPSTKKIRNSTGEFRGIATTHLIAIVCEALMCQKF